MKGAAQPNTSSASYGRSVPSVRAARYVSGLGSLPSPLVSPRRFCSWRCFPASPVRPSPTHTTGLAPLRPHTRPAAICKPPSCARNCPSTQLPFPGATLIDTELSCIRNTPRSPESETLYAVPHGPGRACQHGSIAMPIFSFFLSHQRGKPCLLCSCLYLACSLVLTCRNVEDFHVLLRVCHGRLIQGPRHARRLFVGVSSHSSPQPSPELLAGYTLQLAPERRLYWQVGVQRAGAPFAHRRAFSSAIRHWQRYR